LRRLPTRLDGPILIEPVVHGDDRGFFLETFRLDSLAAIGLEGVTFVQENHSRSARGVLRGMHFQIGDGIGKLVRCARGAIFDVAIDLRAQSPTYGQWDGVELNDRNLHQFWVPVGFAHGFYTLSEVADVLYKQTAYYDPNLERAISWNDPDVAVDWPIVGEPALSAKDAVAPTLREIASELPF
jgi:dTDP-4-dehydrorhamnose 3,5-epimerase